MSKCAELKGLPLRDSGNMMGLTKLYEATDSFVDSSGMAALREASLDFGPSNTLKYLSNAIKDTHDACCMFLGKTLPSALASSQHLPGGGGMAAVRGG